MTTLLPKFGTMLRALRMGWSWYAPQEFFVRCSPGSGDNSVVEIAKTFEALSKRIAGQHYALCDCQNLSELLEMCEALQVASTVDRDYQCYEVDDKGRIIRPPAA